MNKNKVLLGGILLCIFIMVLLNDLLLIRISEDGRSSLFVKAQTQDDNVDDGLADIISFDDSLSPEDVKTLEELNRLPAQKKIIIEARDELLANRNKYETMLTDLKVKVEKIRKEIQNLNSEDQLLGQMIQDLEASE